MREVKAWRLRKVLTTVPPLPVDRYREHRQSPLPIGASQALHGRHLFQARLAPRRPEVQEHNLAPEGTEGDRRPIRCGDAELRSRLGAAEPGEPERLEWLLGCRSGRRERRQRERDDPAVEKAARRASPTARNRSHRPARCRGTTSVATRSRTAKCSGPGASTMNSFTPASP